MMRQGGDEDPGGDAHGRHPLVAPRSMTRATGMSQSSVSRICRAFGLKPHVVDTFKLPPAHRVG